MSFPAVVDSSMLHDFKQCPIKFAQTYIGHWKSKTPNVHLHAGAAFARGLEVARREFYELGKSVDDSVAAGLGALISAYGDFIPPVQSAKTLERMCGALEFYFSNYPLNSDQHGSPVEIPALGRAIEYNFVMPLPIHHPETGEPLQFCGRWDGIINFASGIFGLDDKTTTQLGQSWGKQWILRSQFSGYAWAAQQAGMRLDGFVIRGVAILKEKYTTQQVLIYRPDWQIERWYAEMLEWVADMIECYQSNSWRHNLDNSCADFGGCTYLDVCDSPDPASYLERDFERRAWDPLTRVETKL
jgi:hypothetical protein